MFAEVSWKFIFLDISFHVISWEVLCSRLGVEYHRSKKKRKRQTKLQSLTYFVSVFRTVLTRKAQDKHHITLNISETVNFLVTIQLKTELVLLLCHVGDDSSLSCYSVTLVMKPDELWVNFRIIGELLKYVGICDIWVIFRILIKLFNYG